MTELVDSVVDDHSQNSLPIHSVDFVCSIATVPGSPSNTVHRKHNCSKCNSRPDCDTNPSVPDTRILCLTSLHIFDNYF